MSATNDDHAPDNTAKGWEKLSLEQLRGADYAIRRLHTSPVFRGQALALLREQHAQVAEVMKAKALT